MKITLVLITNTMDISSCKLKMDTFPTCMHAYYHTVVDLQYCECEKFYLYSDTVAILQ